MNVLLCATCATRLTEPVRRLDEMPGYRGRYGLPGPDGRRHGPPSVQRGTYVVDPLPFGAPLGVNHLCRCGAEVAVVAVDCTSDYETRLVPDAVRVEAAA
ncbi:hypothetical protein [Streptomyces sp. AC550_RSS872]|uniref:hypothetical protein n=1 Tax=Streptomyces sp. AC550_RSS872 TaxID=2823689 RepID=UPI001C273032|nr:hypothetical protein [Streptomyces sp. AC550_RSS872]